MSLNTQIRTLLTVITEAAIEQVLVRDLDRLGVRGYTISDARGRGSHGVREGAWTKSANIRIEIVFPRAMAESTLLHLQATYFANYAMVAFLQDVEVLRSDKFE
ncbi:P-II family nitrogen regulator [Iodobacter ciconiae]|uniref:Transcriptional regulator n=1 Tax=Iodobacter ciconiae TaxID=2496266 RepID=A0A3S8ZQD4_9NEIS|nr:transcriptional regulator [Iodobacter ciconiae]AZN35652.1 transcriptional regulator [Iodobacter ciconiae]